ncbi:MAG TPA: hypothetical protein VHH35_10535 [Pyrinomonadaceae bacterium]|nr:hypothetical protein [Pyrinomonadaceae bacterium]
MPSIPIEEYALTWTPNADIGRIRLRLANNEVKTINVKAAEFAAMAAILNESPISFHEEDGTIFTGKEPIGGT